MELMKNSTKLKLREKPIWIDVLLHSQQEILRQSSANLVLQIEQRFKNAREHILFVDKSFFKGAWCLFKIAISSHSGCNHYVCAPQTSINRKVLLDAVIYPYEEMKTTHKKDLLSIRHEVLRVFEASEEFDKLVQKMYFSVKSALLFEVANMYRIGKSQPGKGGGLAKNSKNEFRALEIYRSAADLRHAESEYWVGNFYEYGRGGLRENEAEAVRRYQCAAVNGYARGIEPEKDYSEQEGGDRTDPVKKREEYQARAAEMYRMAADRGHPAAQFDLAEFYEAGKGGLPKDAAKARALYLAAAEQGYPKAVARVKDLPPLPDQHRSLMQRFGMTFAYR
jgi:hypothetical protein